MGFRSKLAAGIQLELFPTSPEFLSYELIFNSDLNDDGVIGETDSKILYETSDYILSLNSSNQFIEVFARDGLFHQLLNKDGSPVYQGDQENHVYKAIENVDDQLQLLVHKPSLEQYNLYKIDDQWRIVISLLLIKDPKNFIHLILTYLPQFQLMITVY